MPPAEALVTTSDPLDRPLQRQVASAWPVATRPGERVVIGLSGGPDSTALLRAIVHLRDGDAENVIVAHFNHRLRDQAEAEEQFCRQLAQHLGAAWHRSEPLAGQIAQLAAGEGLESAARTTRYQFLTETAKARGARYVAVGHNADDQVETVLHHLLRGTGLAGLAGIRPVRQLHEAVSLVRPLLSLTRTEILHYLQGLGQTYCQDDHNHSRQFTRSRIRTELLPLLEASYQRSAWQSLLHVAQIAAESQQIFRQMAERLLEDCLLPIVPAVGDLPLCGPGAAGGSAPSAVRLDCRPLSCRPMSCRASRGRRPASTVPTRWWQAVWPDQLPAHLIREMFVTLWQRQGWPQQAMTFDHWNRLAQLAQATGSNVADATLPGKIRARRDHRYLEIACPPPESPSGIQPNSKP